LFTENFAIYIQSKLQNTLYHITY